MVQALSGPGGQVEFGTSWIQYGATDGLQLSFEVEILA